MNAPVVILPELEFFHQFRCRACIEPFDIPHDDYIREGWPTRPKSERICVQCKAARQAAKPQTAAIAPLPLPALA